MAKDNVVTERKKAFLREYLKALGEGITPNASEIVRRVGYTCKSQQSVCNTANRLMKDVYIRSAIDDFNKKAADNCGLNREYIIKNLMKISERCLSEAKPVIEWNTDTNSYEQAQDEKGNLVWQFDSSGANKANENLAKILGLFVKKVELDVNVDRAAEIEKARKRAGGK